MKSKITLTLLLLLLPVMYFMGGGVFAQTYQINTPTAYQPTSIVQGGAPGTYKVDVVNNSAAALNGAVFSLTLPAGMEYVAGTIVGGTQANISNLRTPTFTLNSIPSGNILVVTFNARINCGYTPASTIGYSVASGSTTLATGSSAVATNTPSPAFVLTTVPNPQVLNTDLKNDGTRTIKFKNSGNIPVTTVYLESNVTTAAQIPSYKISSTDNGTVSAVANGQRVTLTGTALQNAITTSVGGANASFDPGEEITIVIHEQLVSCATGSSVPLTIRVGSGDVAGSMCFVDSSTASISAAVGNPSISLTRLTGTTWPTFCTNGTVSYTIKNEGSGSASSLFNIKMPWSTLATSSIVAPNVEPAGSYTINKVSLNGTDITSLVLKRNGTGSSALIPGVPNCFVIDMAGLTNAYGSALQNLDGDGKYDDLLAGESIQLDFEYGFNQSSYKTCTINSFTLPSSSTDYFSLGTSFQDQCGTRTTRSNYASGALGTYSNPTFQVGSQQFTSFSASLSKVALSPGDRIKLTTNFGGTLSGAFSQGGKIIKTFTLILPDGLDYDATGTTRFIWSVSGSSSVIPESSISYNAATKTLVLTPLATLTGLNSGNDVLEVPLVVNLSGDITNKTIQYSSTIGFVGCGVTAPYGCSSNTLNYSILDTNCATVGTTSFDMTRATFGYVPAPTNTNIWYTPTAFVNENTAGINLHGAVSKDKVKATFTGIVHSTDFSELWARVRYTSNSTNITQSNFDHLSATGTDVAGTITVVKALDGSILTTDITVADVVFSYDAGTSSQLQQVNLSEKIGTGKAINYTLQVGDKITVNWYTKVTRDNLSYVYSALQNLEGSLYTKDAGGIASSCQAIPVDFSIQRLSLGPNTNIAVQSVVGLNSLRIMASLLNGNSSLDVSGDHFPNEVRNYGVFRNVTWTVPGIWIIDPNVGKEPYVFATSIVGAVYKVNPEIFKLTYSGGNTIVTANNSALGSNGLPLSTANIPILSDWIGVNGNQNLSIFLLPVCATPGNILVPTVQNYDLYTTAADNSNTESNIQNSFTERASVTYYNYTANAVPTLQNVDGVSSTVNWQVRVTNTSDTAAIVAAGGSANLPNNWMSFVAPNNNITVTKLVDIATGTEYPVTSYGPGKYWVKLGDIGSSATYNVVATYTSCSNDKLQYTYSFGATGYPIDPDQGYNASITTCPSSQSKFDLNLFPKDVNISMVVTSPSNPVQFCTNETPGENKINYSFAVANTAVGNAENLLLEAYFPEGYGARTGTSQITYAGVTKTLNDPTYNTAKGVWEWNISMDPNGVPFLPGAAAGNNSFVLTYQGETQCSYISGSNVNYIMRATSGCGKVIEYTASGTSMELSMKPSSLNTYYLAPSVVNLSNDGSSAVYKMEVTNQGTLPLKADEVINVVIPSGIDYVTGSVVHIAGAANVTAPTKNTVLGNNRVLTFPLPVGADGITLNQNETASFSIEFKIANAANLSCGLTKDAINLQAIFSVPDAVCGSNPCPVRIITGGALSDLNVTKTSLEVTPVSGTAKYLNSTTNNVTIKYTVKNTGTITTNTPIIVDFFNDVNGDGAFTSGEPILYSQTIAAAAATLAAGGTTAEQTTATFAAPESGICKITAIIRSGVNTQVCADASKLIPVHYVPTNTTFSACAESNVTIGDLPNGSTVSWSPATYLSDAAISNPVFNYNGPVLATPTPFIYTATVTHPGGCTDTYTNTVTVNPKPLATISYPNATYCNRGTASVTQTGTTGGTYTGDTGLSINSTTGLINLASSISGNHTVTYSFTDGICQNVVTTLIKINETVLPAVLADINGQCSVTPAAPTLTDICAGLVTGTPDKTFPITAQGTTIVKWTFNYGGGYTQTANQNIIIKDTQKPVVPVLDDIIEQCSSTPTAPTTTDNCAGVVTGTTTTVFPITTQGTTLVEWTFNDGNGNTSTATQNVIITDTTAPIVPVLADVTAECEATPTAPTPTDNCAGTITGTPDRAFPITTQGTTVVTWTFDDGNGNVVTAKQNVIIKDITAPVAPVLEDFTAQCNATLLPPDAIDACTGTVIGTTSTVFPIMTQGTTIVTWTFDDGHGNVSSATQNVIITDTEAPVAPVLTDVTGECEAIATAPVAVDACKGNITGTTSTVFPITTQGTTVVTWSFADGNGNTSTVTQNVIVKDTQKPVVPVLTDVTGQCSATPTAPTTTDNCAGTITGTTSTVFPITTQGTTVVTWTFDDGNGNTSTATQNVIVKDTEAPVKPVLADVTGQCDATPVTPTTTDACKGIITGTTSTVFPITTQGTTVVTWSFADGNGNTSTATQNVIVKDVTAPIVPVLADVTGQCSATPTAPTTTDNCAGTITGTTSTVFPIITQGTTVVTWTFDDGNGNTSTAMQNVIVKDTEAPVKPVLADVKGQCDATAIAPTTTDACKGIITGTTATVFPITTQGTTVVTWTFDDGNGNSVTANQNVIVDNTVPPTPPVLNDVVEQCSATLTAPTSTNSCTGAVVTATTTTVFPITTQGTTVVTWTFDDGLNNVSTATQNVIITDTEAPVAPVLTDVTGDCSVTLTAPVAVDACKGNITGTTTTTFPITTQGTTIVTWTFADGNGNASTATQNVILTDKEAPVVPVLTDVIGQCSVTLAGPIAIDNCAGSVTGTTSTVFPITTVGTTVVTWTFDDGNGNVVKADQNVIIENIALAGTPSTLCAVDGTGYVLSLSVTGQAPYAVTGTGAPGTWSGNNWTSDKILAGVDYNVSIQDAYACNIVSVADTAPICCVFEVVSPTFPQTVITCYSQLPTATTLTEAQFEALGNGNGRIGDIPCGVIQITASNSPDPGCNGNIVRTYTVTEYEDPNHNGIRDNGEDTVLNTSVTIQNFTLDRADFTMPADGSVTVACASEVKAPFLPVVLDNCGNTLTPSAPVISALPACNGIVTYTYTFADCEGNTHDWVYTYTINNTVAPTGKAPANLTLQCKEDVPVADINAVTNIKGNCNANVTVTVADSNNGGSGCTASPYIVTRTYTLTDCGGLTTTLVQTITVIDTTPPVFNEVLPLGITVECSDEIPAAAALTASDNCSAATVVFNEVKMNGGCTGNYQLVRTWTATDACGNPTVHTQVVKVQDTKAPVFVETLPPATVEADCNTIPEAVVLTAVDNCGTARVDFTETKIDGDCSGRYQLVRTWVAVDDCGNERSFTQNINVSCLADIFTGLSPNGDGINDTFVIGNIDCFPNNTVKIFNRYGVVVYEKTSYDNVTNPFEGISDGRGTVAKGSMLPTGTYFYTFEYDNNESRVQKSGYLYISNQ